MAESSQAKPAQTVSAGEPAQSPVERVTEKKATDKKKGDDRACRRCRPAKTTARTASGSQLRPGDGTPVSNPDRAAKESFCPGYGMSASIPDRERTDEQLEHNRNWIPWIIGACLAGGSLAYISRNTRLRRWRQARALSPG